MENQAQAPKIDDIFVEVFSDHGTLVELTMLLSYIRDVINNNQSKTVTLNIGKNRKTSFKFAVNKMEVPELKCQDVVNIG